jgi:hypothetical protein
MGRNKWIAAFIFSFPLALHAGAVEVEKSAKKINSGEININGVVIDSKTKKPLQGVIISTTPARFMGDKEISTNNQGAFKIESVPVNDVLLTFEKKGYKTVKKEAAKLKDSELMKLVIELIPQFDEDPDGMESPLRPIIGTGFSGA